MVDGSQYNSEEILKDYAQTYLKKTQELDDYKVTKTEVNGNEATITVELTPYAGLSEANPIGNARTQLFGGMDEDTFIRQSQNKDLKAIKNLITLKLYAMYYGDLAHKPELASSKTTFTFNMDKKGDNFMVSNDDLIKIMKEYLSQTYAKSSENNSTEAIS